MKLTIVETGLAPDTIRDDHPDYPAMFRRLIGAADANLTYETVSVVKGAPLPDPAALDAILITGSPAGVYDPEPWMTPLMDFIRWAADAKTPQIGVCFGHQAMAQALGGHVTKSDKGWGVGRHAYDIMKTPRWMDEVPADGFALAVSHQDQVLIPPPGAQVIAASPFTDFAALHYKTIPAISFQGHPEFDDDFARALYMARRERLGETVADEAVASLTEPHQNASVARWMAAFLNGAIS